MASRKVSSWIIALCWFGFSICGGMTRQTIYASTPIGSNEPREQGAAELHIDDALEFPADLLEREFAKEMIHHDLAEVVALLGPPLGSTKDSKPASEWKVLTSIKKPGSNDVVLSDDAFALHIEVTGHSLSQGLRGKRKAAVVVCAILQNIETRQIWSQPCLGSFHDGLDLPGASIALRVVGWRLPVGKYKLSCVTFLQPAPGSRLSCADCIAHSFTVLPSLSEDQFSIAVTSLRSDPVATPEGRARVFRNALGNVRITPNVLKVLGKWQEVTQLDLSGLCVPREMFEVISHFSHLESLALKNASFKADGLSYLNSISTLRTLDCSGAQLIPGSFKSLSHNRNIEVLKLSDIDLGRADLIALGTFGSLSTLHLVRCGFIDGLNAGSLFGTTTISDLSLKGSKLSAQDVLGVSRLPALRRLDLSNTRVERGKVSSIQFGDAIEFIDLSNAMGFRATELLVLKCPKLKRIVADAGSLAAETTVELTQRGVAIEEVKRPSPRLAALWND